MDVDDGLKVFMETARLRRKDGREKKKRGKRTVLGKGTTRKGWEKGRKEDISTTKLQHISDKGYDDMQNRKINLTIRGREC